MLCCEICIYCLTILVLKFRVLNPNQQKSTIINRSRATNYDAMRVAANIAANNAPATDIATTGLKCEETVTVIMKREIRYCP